MTFRQTAANCGQIDPQMGSKKISQGLDDMTLTQLDSLFDNRKNYVRFELVLNAPFPTVVPPAIFTKLYPDDFLVSYRLTSQMIREGSDQDFSPQVEGVVNMYPSLPATTLSFLRVDMAINSDEIADFSKIFGNDIWHCSHLYWQDRIFGEINGIIDLARFGGSPQYIIRNVSPFDMRSARILAVEDEVERTLTNYLLPQIVGEIDVPHDAIGRSVVPFYLVNYLDARRYCCPSSDNLEHQRCFPFGGSGSSLIEFMRFQFGGASAA